MDTPVAEITQREHDARAEGELLPAYPVRITTAEIVRKTVGYLHLCAQCGTEFETVRPVATTCGKKCRSKRHAARQRELQRLTPPSTPLPA